MKNELMQRLRLKYPPPDGYCRWGRIQDVSATLLNAWLPGVFMGELCCIKPGEELAEVVGINGSKALLSPFTST
ncbi:EscN/YscN/HrcN family type III secretion system ATPase, partial [Salmonella enterica subsp. enterica serovar Ouagadougou]|nr:EscN/YscN/HrcN family type III secretion system ATPase [Salmonella enterica subsp. enterica serovar Ouagadougou]